SRSSLSASAAPPHCEPHIRAGGEDFMAISCGSRRDFLLSTLARIDLSVRTKLASCKSLKIRAILLNRRQTLHGREDFDLWKLVRQKPGHCGCADQTLAPASGGRGRTRRGTDRLPPTKTGPGIKSRS